MRLLAIFHFKLFINLKNIILFLILKILIKKIKNDIFKSTKKTFFFEEIVDIYILSYLQNWKNKKKGKIKNIVFKSPNEIDSIETL